MVRITAPVGDSEDDALKAAIDLAENSASILPEFIPD
jgi:hypothetical protein